MDNGIVDKVLPASEAVQNADLIIFATPMQSMLPILQEVKDFVPQTAIISDVGSVKQSLYLELKSHCPNLLPQCVFAHPIAGAELAGISASRQNLFARKHLVLAETPELKPENKQLMTDFWQQLGSKVVTMSLAEHDAIFAKTSHLPHLIAFSLVNFLYNQDDRDRLFDMAAAGFYDFTRIASSDASMWRDICVTNRQELLVALDSFRAELDGVRDMITNLDQQKIYDYFEAAKDARNSGLRKKNEQD